MARWVNIFLAGVMGVSVALERANAQGTSDLNLVGGDPKRQSYGILGVLSYSVIPDTTASSLSIDSKQGDDPTLQLLQIGGGFTVDETYPLYLEGFIGYSRYDPDFIFSGGEQQQVASSRWTSAAVTTGVGWEFSLTDEIVFRPIANFSLGHVESDASLAGSSGDDSNNDVLDFLEDGELNVFGVGGSAVLDYARSKEDYELDIELRYTHIYLQSIGGTSDSVEGDFNAATLNLWTRLRWPTGIDIFQRPLRYVAEASYSEFLGDQSNALGFDHLARLGGGLEIDVGELDIFVERARLLGRYVIGKNVSGWSIGFAVSF